MLLRSKYLLAALWIAFWWLLPMLCVHFGGRLVNFIGVLTLAAVVMTHTVWDFLRGARS